MTDDELSSESELTGKNFTDDFFPSTGYQYVKYGYVDNKPNRWSFITIARRRRSLWRLAISMIAFYAFEWIVWPVVAPIYQIHALERWLREQPRQR